MMPCCLQLAHRIGDGAAHDRAGEHEHSRARKTRDGTHRGGDCVLADERDRVHRDALAADVVTVRLADRANRHLAHLRAAAHDDHALAVDLHQRLGHVDGPHDAKLLEPGHEARQVVEMVDLEIEQRPVRHGAERLNGHDVRRMIREHARDLEEYPGRVVCLDDQRL